MDTTKSSTNGKEKEILHSQTIKAGQRIYYIDVKQNRKDEMYLSITESKKMTIGDPDMPRTSFEKHKIFIYREDFQKFLDCFQNALQYIAEQQGVAEPRPETMDGEIEIDLDF